MKKSQAQASAQDLACQLIKAVQQGKQQEEERLAWAETVLIETVGNPPVTMAELKQNIRESHYRVNLNNPRRKNPSFSYEALIAHLRHNHTNYDKLIAQLAPYETYKYDVLKKRCNEKAEEILGIIRASGR